MYKEDRGSYSPSRMGISAGSAGKEALPFTVKLVHSGDDLMKAIQIRQRAYARHLPDFAVKLAEPEAQDNEKGSVVLLAQSKLDGSPLGSARIQSNMHRALSIEQAFELPGWLKGKHLVEVTRLGIDEGRIGRVVKLALLKASFMYCAKNDVDYVLLAARAPLDRQYAQLLFEDIFPDRGFAPLPYANNLPHRAMSFEIKTGPKKWIAAQHPLLNFMYLTEHPDIDVTDYRFV